MVTKKDITRFRFYPFKKWKKKPYLIFTGIEDRDKNKNSSC
jgi:hypothetical protein